MTFAEWLFKAGRTRRTAKNYSGAMEGRLSGHKVIIESTDFDHDTLRSNAKFKIYCNIHDRLGELYDLNVRGKDMYRRALRLYSDYVLDSQPSPNTSRKPTESAATEIPSKNDIYSVFESQVKISQNDSVEARSKRLDMANLKPSRTTTLIEVFNRNPDVVAETLKRAAGYCESCSEPAPFIRKSDHSPYLEVHHTIPLAAGGDDTVANAEALCPNCHRQKHFG